MVKKKSVGASAKDVEDGKIVAFLAYFLVGIIVGIVEIVINSNKKTKSKKEKKKIKIR